MNVLLADLLALCSRTGQFGGFDASMSQSALIQGFQKDEYLTTDNAPTLARLVLA